MAVARSDKGITRVPVSERIVTYVSVGHDNGCWVWEGGKDPNGYGFITLLALRTSPFKAHRVVYEEMRQPIPKGLVLDHLCRNTSCVNPNHLDPVTQKENMHRSPFFVGLSEGSCKRGHFAREVNRRGKSFCRECERENVRRYRAKMS